MPGEQINARAIAALSVILCGESAPGEDSFQACKHLIIKNNLASIILLYTQPYPGTTFNSEVRVLTPKTRPLIYDDGMGKVGRQVWFSFTASNNWLVRLSYSPFVGQILA